jgi:diguanylate cyclase (GGDEF)-like protein
MLDRAPIDPDPRPPVAVVAGPSLPSRRPTVPAAERLRVLAVTADAELAGRLQELLVRPGMGIDVAVAPTLSSGERQIEESEPDAVLVDLELTPGESLEALERLMAAAPRVPMIALDATERAAASLSRGAQDHLPRTALTGDALRRSIRHSIGRQRVKNDLEDVTGELRRANARLAELVLVDPLTDLPNRRGLQQMLSREMRWARREGTELVLFLIDLDDFRRVNDSFGHTVGDVALREIAACLREALRATDSLARVGGDEFMVLLPQTRLAEALRVAAKLRLAIANTQVAVGEGQVQLTACVAVTLVTDVGAGVDELWSLAHQRLRAGKRLGRNRVIGPGSPRGAGPERSAEFDDGERVLAALRSGQTLRHLRQPIVDLARGAGTAIGYEFLARCDDPVYTLPRDFFRLAFDRGALTAVDRRCFELGLAAARDLPADCACHLNLLPTTLIEVPVDHLVERLAEHRPAGRVCLEISEQQLVGDPSYLLAPVAVLRHAGVRLAVDDVGFGRSCLESLVLLEPDLIKIDRRCVEGLTGSAEQRRSLERLLKVAATLGAGVIAEGVEAESDLAVLRELGVGLAQGFLLGPPR